MARADRGFALLDRGKQKEIARKGGRAAHQRGTAHEWTPDEARKPVEKGAPPVVVAARRRPTR